jgi:cold shock protein
MPEGTVKCLSVSKKYGSIVPDEGGKDVFLHMSAPTAANLPFLDDGTRVSFELEQDTGRVAAVRIAVLAAGDASPDHRRAPPERGRRTGADRASSAGTAGCALFGPHRMP